MALTSGFYNSINHDRQYYNDQVSRIFEGIIHDGIFDSIGTAMVVVTANSGMGLQIGIGRAWFNGRWVNNDTIYTIACTEPYMVLDRIDTVVLEIDNSDAVRAASYKVIAGEPASSPVAPTLINNENVHQYPLADVYIHALGATENYVISQADITNRVGTDPCPFITGIIESIDISTLLQQWHAQFNEWWQTVQNIMSGSTAAEVIAAVTSHEQAYTLAAANWVSSTVDNETVYLYTITNATYIGTNTNQEVIPGLAITKAQLEMLQAANIIDGGQDGTNHTMVLKAMGDVPTDDIPIRVLFRGIK